jgi:hypothetical protein
MSVHIVPPKVAQTKTEKKKKKSPTKTIEEEFRKSLACYAYCVQHASEFHENLPLTTTGNQGVDITRRKEKAHSQSRERCFALVCICKS